MIKKNVMKILTLLAVCVLLISPCAVFAQDDGAEIRPTPKGLADYDLPGMDIIIELKVFEPWSIVQMIEFVMHKGGLKNVVISQGVQGTSSKLRFDNVTVAEALEVVLSVNNLAYEVKGGIITIMSDAEYMSIYGSSFYDHKKVKVVTLEYADTARISQMLAPIKSAPGTIVPDSLTGTLILIDTPEKIKEMESIIARADISTKTETVIFKLQYADVEDMKAKISTMISKEAGMVQDDKRSKTIIVTDVSSKVRKIEDMIAAFDIPQKQVFIEAKIIEITLGDDLSFGINWKYLFESTDPRYAISAISKTGLPSPGTGLERESTGERSGNFLSYNTIVSGGDLTALVDALKVLGDTKILSNPHIAVLDGEEAEIKVIEDQPYKEVSIESGTTNITGVTYLFKEVGVLLNVTPKINDNGFINVAIKPEISSISEWYDGGPQEGTPVIKRAYATTTVTVKDGVTIIIGGMIRDVKSTSTVKVPILGSIPLLGALFRHEAISTRNAETVVFLTPKIITGDKPYQRMYFEEKKPKPMRSIGVGDEKIQKPLR